MVSKNNKTRAYALGLCRLRGLLVASLTLSACGGGTETPAAPTVQAMSDAAVAGEALFNDKSLSASGQQSCGTCHVKSRAFTADPAVDKGGARPNLAHVIPSCGKFKVPTLRNIALTAPYSHNGVFTEIHTAVQWYFTRDINNNTGNNPSPVPSGPGGNPYQAVGTFYTAADGTPDLYQYNDLPVLYDSNVNTGEVPYTAPTFAGGNSPTMNAQEIDDLVSFLCTLTDGFDPNNPSAYNVPAQCQPIASPSP